MTRCRVIPLPDHQVSFEVDGVQRLAWHYGTAYPRPFFYPLVGPSGETLLRMGHPGAPDHDHHRGIWFAHHKVGGVDFWTEQATSVIRQTRWLCYEQSDESAAMAVELAWHANPGSDPLLQQELIVQLNPLANGELLLEIQSRFRAMGSPVELQKSNFGILAVRVSRELSEYFGAGTLADSEGRIHESNIFEQAARWVDYSKDQPEQPEGIAYLDHPQNPGTPSRWHVREDGWMVSSVSQSAGRTVPVEQPLLLRYALFVHRDSTPQPRIEQAWKQFAELAPLHVLPSRIKHVRNTIERSDR